MSAVGNPGFAFDLSSEASCCLSTSACGQLLCPPMNKCGSIGFKIGRGVGKSRRRCCETVVDLLWRISGSHPQQDSWSKTRPFLNGFFVQSRQPIPEKTPYSLLCVYNRRAPAIVLPPPKIYTCVYRFALGGHSVDKPGCQLCGIFQLPQGVVITAEASAMLVTRGPDYVEPEMQHSSEVEPHANYNRKPFLCHFRQ